MFSLAVLAVLFETVCAILPSSYNVVWNTPTHPINVSSASMPVGGGDIGLNVWAENNTVRIPMGKRLPST